MATIRHGNMDFHMADMSVRIGGIDLSVMSESKLLQRVL